MFPPCVDCGDDGRECEAGQISKAGVGMGAWGMASIRGPKGRPS